MAVFKSSITTRYGDTFTADSDNAAAFVTAAGTGVTRTGNVITVEGNRSNNAGISTDTDWVIFNHKIILEDGARLTANGNNGTHVWFVNCIIEKRGSGTDGQQTLGPTSAQASSSGGSTDTVTGTKANDQTWNYYGCSFLTDTDAVVGVLNFGTIEDCDALNLGNSAGQFNGSFIFQSQNDSVINNFQINNQSRSSAASDAELGVSLFLNSTPASIDGLVMNNTTPYVNRSLTFFEYEQGQSAQLGTADGRILITAGSSTNIINSKTPLAPDGNVIWRNQNDGDGNILQRQRVTKQYFSNAPLTVGRQEVMYHIVTNGTFSDDENTGTANQSSATTDTFIYYTDTDGILEGTIDINVANATVANQDFVNLDIPVQVLWSTTSNDGNQTGNEEFNYTVTVNEMSLWGQTYAEYDKGGSTIVRATADADGYFVQPDTGNILDPVEVFMERYSQDTDNIKNVLTGATGDINIDAVAANWKLAVYNRSPNFDFGMWDTDVIDGSAFDLDNMTTTVDTITFNPANTTPISRASGSEGVQVDCPVSAGDSNITMVIAADDTLQELRFDQLNVSGSNTMTINGGTWTGITGKAGTIEGLQTFSASPTEAQFTARDATFDCTLAFDVGTEDAWIRLDECNMTDLTLSNDSTTNVLNVVFSGTGTPSITSGHEARINLINQFVVTVEGTGAYSDGDVTLRWASSATDTVGTFDSEGATEVVIAATGTDGYTVTFNLTHTHTHLWYAIATDGYELVNGVDVEENQTENPGALPNVDFDTTVTDLRLTAGMDLRNFTVAEVADATGSINVNLTDTEGFDATQATDTITRFWLRKYVMEHDEWLDAVAKGFIPPAYISFLGNNLELPDATRLDVQHDAANTRYQLGSIVLSAGGDDLYDQLTTTPLNQQVFFAQQTNGASSLQIEQILNDRLLTKDSLVNLGLLLPILNEDGDAFETTPNTPS